MKEIGKTVSGHNSIFELAGSIKVVGVILLFVENDVTMTIANSFEVTVLNASRIEAPRV